MINEKFNLKVATTEDIPDILSLCAQFWEASPYIDYLDYNEEKLKNWLETHIQLPNFICILGIINNTAVGLISGIKHEYMMALPSYAAEIMWWVNMDYRKSRLGMELLKSFEYWCEHIVKVNSIHIGSVSSQRDMSKLYNRLGYKEIEKAYVKWI